MSEDEVEVTKKSMTVIIILTIHSMAKEARIPSLLRLCVA